MINTIKLIYTARYFIYKYIENVVFFSLIEQISYLLKFKVNTHTWVY